MKLSKSVVEGVEAPASGVALVWDEALPGFGLRVTANGVRSYVVQARVHGKTRRVTLGRHGVLTAEEARKRARATLGRMSEGVDPSEERRRKAAEVKRDKVQSVTLRDVMEGYLRDRRKLKDRSKADIRYHVDHSFKAWADRPIAEISREAVSEQFRTLSDRSHAQANQAFRILRALLNYARAQHRLPNGSPLFLENPVAVLSESRMWNENRARNNYVPLDRIGEWWLQVEALRSDPELTPASRTAADLIAFMALTGLRLGEAQALRWEQIDMDGSSVRLMDTKNRSSVTLPLSGAALRILEARNDGGAFVFPARSGKGHLKDCRATLQKLAEMSGIEATAHDLRRTFRAVAGKVNVELWRTKALMNHRQRGDVTLAHYTDLEDVRYLRPEANRIGEWIEERAQIASADETSGEGTPEGSVDPRRRKRA